MKKRNAYGGGLTGNLLTFPVVEALQGLLWVLQVGRFLVLLELC